MAIVNFFLREPKSKGETSIIMFFSYKGDRLKYYTGLSIKPSNWDSAKQVTKKNVEFNLALETMEKAMLDVYAGFLTRKEQATNELLKAALEEELKLTKGGPSNKAETTLLGLIDEYVKAKGSQRAKGTMQRFQALRSHLVDFEEANGTVTIKHIDHSFNDAFQNLLFEGDKQKNTVGKLIVGLKTVLNWATDMGYQIPVGYKKFSIPVAPTNIIALSEEEIFKIYKKEGLVPELAITRDLFCLSAFTGQRFSDIIRIVPGMIANNVWRITDQKTKKSRSVPLEKEALEILKRYNFNMAGLKSNQKVNTGIKTVAELAGIDEPITVTRYFGNRQKDITLPKWKLLHFHSGKKSYISNFLRNRGRLEVLMQIVGNNERTLKPYVDLSNEDRKSESKSVFTKMRRTVAKKNEQEKRELAFKKKES